MTEYRCMTPEELAFWVEQQVARARALRPCTDCPAWFARQAQADGCCQRSPQKSPKFVDTSLAAQRRRAYKRDWMRAYRAQLGGTA